MLRLQASDTSSDLQYIFGTVCSLPFSSKKKKSVDPEEEDVEEKDYENSDEEDGNHGVERYGFSSSSSVFDFSASHSARDSGLPSTNDVFSQISGPPEFLNNRTEADEEATARDAEHAKRMTQMKGSPFDDVNCVSTKESPAASAILVLMFRLLHTYCFGWFIGVVMEAKPQLVGIHERVRNNIDAQPS
ncbi:hypothetical protein YC2023_113119 [Brassica napus]|uniref:(rape) hypothetical protein n=1 Tax=Brassica napus TaxID=3708 RepID=A0A816IJN4_BRANA|nr:unnamed protein product [Brassica napus]